MYVADIAGNSCRASGIILSMAGLAQPHLVIGVAHDSTVLRIHRIDGGGVGIVIVTRPAVPGAVAVDDG